MRGTLRTTSVIGALLLIAPIISCVGTDFLVVDTGTMVVTVQIVNSGATRYESATVQLRQISVRPLDPDADANLGNVDQGLLLSSAVIDLNQASIELPPLPLHGGQYRVTGLRTLSASLMDSDPPSMSPVCVEQVIDPGLDQILGTADDFSQLPDPRFTLSPAIPTSFEYDDFGDPTFNVTLDGGSLTLTLDALQLIRDFENAFNCTPAPAGTCPAGQPSFACLSAFNGPQYLADSKSAFGFN